MKITIQTLASTGALALMLAACGLAPTAKAAQGPSDAQIVGIVLAADQIDIDYGKLALAKSKDKAVRDFAQRMITDHSAVSKRVTGVAEKLGVKGEDSPTSDGLKKTGAATKSRVAVLPGVASVEPRLALLDPTKTGTQADFGQIKEIEDLKTLETKVNASIAKGEMMEAVERITPTTASTRKATNPRSPAARRGRRNISLPFFKAVEPVNALTLHEQSIGDGVTMSEWAFDLTTSNGRSLSI